MVLKVLRYIVSDSGMLICFVPVSVFGTLRVKPSWLTVDNPHSIRDTMYGRGCILYLPIPKRIADAKEIRCTVLDTRDNVLGSCIMHLYSLATPLVYHQDTLMTKNRVWRMKSRSVVENAQLSFIDSEINKLCQSNEVDEVDVLSELLTALKELEV